VTTARSKGLRERTVILRHVVRNALIPVGDAGRPDPAAGVRRRASSPSRSSACPASARS
jgi:ABC-type microcin C transport system permease subunit YejB